jgi:ribosomal protein L11 methylase PrmA
MTHVLGADAPGAAAAAPARSEIDAAATEPSSFRDPSGFLFERAGTIYRQIDPAGAAGYERLMRSGLYDKLTGAGLLIPHAEVSLEERLTDAARYVLQPERIPFISYCYEWCFGQLKAAALATLDLQRRALQDGMSLKDASAYNIQFRGESRPVLIDTLSFELYRDGAPWVAYRQFCQHFLAPLALMAHGDIRMSQMLRPNLDGLPLDLASRLLPFRDRFHPALLTHIFLHSAAQRQHANDNARAAATAPAVDRPGGVPRSGMSLHGLLGLIDSLESGIRSLNWRPMGTVWGAYYDGGTNYSPESFEAKRAIVARLLDGIRPVPAFALDIGANTGVFSRLATERGIFTISMDSDQAAVEQGYQECRRTGAGQMLPLVQDLTNPSPGIGWAGTERKSFIERCSGAQQRSESGSVAFALALIHHLAIGNNVPLPRIASLFATLTEHLLIEWVPKQDSQVQRLLATREDIFPGYTEAGFERAFCEGPFVLERREPIPATKRVLYHLRRRRQTSR